MRRLLSHPRLRHREGSRLLLGLQGAPRLLAASLHRIDRLLAGDEFLRGLVVPGLRREGPVPGPLAGLLETGGIDCFLIVIVVGLEGREGCMALLADATILAYELNGTPLDIPHGAPLRLRFERQLGYKQTKYVMMIELVETLAGIGGGMDGYWEDQGYEWYAGI